MTPRRKTSRRRSAANSLAAKRLDEAVFYLDESIHSRLLVDRLRECGATVERAGAAFPFGTQDEIWLTACGERGWIALTRDKRIRRRVLEREAIRLSGGAVFALTVGEATAAETADVITKLLGSRLAVSPRRPSLTIYLNRSNQVSDILFHIIPCQPYE